MKARNTIIVVLVLGIVVYGFINFSGVGDGLLDDGGTDDSLDDLVSDIDEGTDDVTNQETGASGPPNALVDAWSKIIFAVESGNGNPTSVAVRNNNPGNLVWGGELVQFDDMESGWEALWDDLSAKLRKYPSLTITQIMAKYAPAPDGSALTAGNNPAAYAQAVANALKSAFGGSISVSTTLAQLKALVGL